MNITKLDDTSITITTLELRSFINEARKQFGEAVIENGHFIKRVEDELSDELEGVEKFTTPVPNGGGEMAVYTLTLEQATLVGMRESKGVRRAVLAKLKGKEPQKHPVSPAELSRLEILQLAMDSEQARIKAIDERDHAIATKAQIGSRREATAMATAAAATKKAKQLAEELGRNYRQATVKAVEKAIDEKLPKNTYIPLRRWCKEHGVEAAEVPDGTYGKVKAWPAGAWLECNGIDLSALFTETVINHYEANA